MDRNELIRARKALGMSQKTLAKHMAVSINTYCSWELNPFARRPHDLELRLSALSPDPRGLRDDDMVEISAATRPKWYKRISKGVYQPNHMHPTGHTGRIKRKYLTAWLRGDMATWGEYQAKRAKPSPAIVAHIASAKPAPLDELYLPYEHVGDDDVILEKRLQNFFQNLY